MKAVITLFLLFSASLALGQEKNDQLYDAITNKDSVKVEKLLNDGADANYRKKVKGFEFELSLLIWAIQKNEVKVVQLLVDHKADVNFKDWFKSTPLMYAAGSGSLATVQILLKAGADPNAKDDHDYSVLSAAKEGKNSDVIALIESLQKN